MCTIFSGNHETDSLGCPNYIKQVQIFFEARGLQAPFSRNLCQKMMANPGLTFLLTIICCLSDHCKRELNQYLQQTKADIVFLNETKTRVSENLFDNFTTISSCMGGSSGGVAVSLKIHIPYSRLNHLEDTSVDNVVLTVRLGAMKLLVSTAYDRPDAFGGLRKTIKVIQSYKTYVDKHCLSGALLFGDLNAMHIYWGDKSCNLLGEELVQIADHFSIPNFGEPTFLAANGSSVINFCICYWPLFDRCKHSLPTDEFRAVHRCSTEESCYCCYEIGT